MLSIPTMMLTNTVLGRNDEFRSVLCGTVRRPKRACGFRHRWVEDRCVWLSCSDAHWCDRFIGYQGMGRRCCLSSYSLDMTGGVSLATQPPPLVSVAHFLHPSGNPSFCDDISTFRMLECLHRLTAHKATLCEVQRTKIAMRPFVPVGNPLVS